MDLEGIMPNIFFNTCNYSESNYNQQLKQEKTDRHSFNACYTATREKKVAVTIHNRYGSPNTVKRT